MEPKWVKKKLLVRDLTEILGEHPHILQVKNEHHHLAVKFDTGVTEYWDLGTSPKVNNTFKLPMDHDLFNDRQITVHRQFETNPLYPEEYSTLKNHFLIKRSDLDEAGWCDVRFKIHDLAVELVEEGYLPIQYTDSILREDFDNLLNEDLERYQTAVTRFSAFSTIPPAGRRLIMHFMPCSAENKWEFRPLYHTINNLRGDITRENIVYYLSKTDHITRHPAFYRAFFKQWLDVKNKRVYDLCPDWGFKALAVIAEDGQYYCNSPNVPYLNKMAKYLGGYISGPNQARYNLIILSDVYPVSLEEANQLIKIHAPLADNLIIVIGKDDRQEFISVYKPQRVIRLNNQVTENANSDNYLMLIHQK
jgi:hypothetical protein